jgi:ATP-binding cassette subfamily C protein
MRQFFKIFFKTEDTNPYAILACLLLAGLAEIASISTLLPAVTAIAGGDHTNSSALNEVVRQYVAKLGVEPSLLNLILIVSALLVLRSALSFAALTYAGLATARVAAGLRRRLLLAVMDARWSFYTGQRAGTMASAVSNDATRAANAYFMIASTLAFAIQSICYAAVALLIDWRIAAVGLAIGLAIAAAMNSLVKVAKRAGYKQTDRTADITVLVVDLLANIKPLKSMQRYHHIMETAAATLQRLRRSLVTMEMARQGLIQGSDALIAVIAGLGAYAVHAILRTPIAELFVSGVVFFQVVSLTSKMQRHFQESKLLEGAYVRVQELIELATAARETGTGSSIPDIGAGCRFEQVNFSHAEAPVIRNASLFIPAREITVLQGPSGSGKTTLIDLLIGLHKVDGGRILIGRTPIDDIDMAAWRHRIGYVPQELTLLHASIRDNIALGDPAVTDSAIMEALRQAGAVDFVAQLPNGLDSDVGEMGGRLSGGQRQRISLARALVTNPAILILDEVTSSLDPKTESEIVTNIAELRGRYTIVAITHRPGWTRIADRLYKVAHGRVTEIAEKKRANGNS